MLIKYLHKKSSDTYGCFEMCIFGKPNTTLENLNFQQYVIILLFEYALIEIQIITIHSNEN